MRLYESQCPACTQHAVLHGVCRACGNITNQPQHLLRDDNASESNCGETSANQYEDERGDATDDLPDFDFGTGD